MSERRLIFDVLGRDRLSRVFDRIGDGATRMGRRISRASDDGDRALGDFTRDARGRLHDTRGRFVAAGLAAERMGDDVDRSSSRSRGALSRLMSVVRGVGSAAASAVPSTGALSGALWGVGIAAAVTALPAVGALVPMVAGLGLVAGALKLGLSGVSDAMALAGTDAKEYHKALKKMSPEQREFTKALVAAKKEFAGVGKDVQKAMLPGFTKAVKAAKPLIDELSGGLVVMGKVLGDTADDFSKLMKDSGFQDDFGNTLLLGTEFVRDLTGGLVPLTRSIFDFGAASKPTLDAFGNGISGLMSKGIPGFFTGLKGGIDGSAQMFTGLFNTVNKDLPVLGDAIGEIANSTGPALSEIFESAGDNGAKAFKIIGTAAHYLKPVFGEVGGAVRIVSILLGQVADIAGNVGRVVLESLWPSFRKSSEAVGPLQRLANWLKDNKQATLEFTRVASNGIIGFAGVVISNIPMVIKVFRLMATGVLTALDGIISGAAAAFGWIPGIGPKLKQANKTFDQFKDSFITGLHSAEAQTQSFADKVGPRLAANKLRMNIDNWNQQIAVAKGKLSDKNLPSSKKAALRADISDLEAKVRKAKADLASVKNRSVTVYTNYKVNGTQRGGDVGGNYAAGGLLSGPGTGTSDDIPLMGSDGEFIVNAKATSRNLRLLEAINSGRIARFASGGKVGKGISKSALSAIRTDTAHRMVIQLTASASQIGSMVKELVGDIERAFKGKKSKVDDRLVAMLEKSNVRLKTLAAQRDKIAAKIAEAKAFASSTAATARGTATLSSLGEDSLTGHGGGIKAGLQSKLAQIRQFSRYISILAKRHLNKSMLRQILEMGPESGFAYASELVGSSQKTISEINGVQSTINKESAKLGRTGADALYDSGRNAGKGFLAGLAGQQKAIEKLMLSIAKGMQKAIRKALGIKSPSTVFAQLGRHTTEGLALGITDRVPAVHRALATVSDAVAGTQVGVPSVAMAGAAGGGRAWTVKVDINIHGATDPIATAREVRRQLLELKRTLGLNISLGVG
ncbi:hypothetical protein [Streptomyces sp. NBC_01262]|uniref:hypothetical protein n=1 Tax=Streptomyces sp. NBC_01262 TaxID=2903803 RepID=UPI002E34877A|nr:hypothetical protein [Streptomyces sp. NBC_01262]